VEAEDNREEDLLSDARLVLVILELLVVLRALLTLMFADPASAAFLFLFLVYIVSVTVRAFFKLLPDRSKIPSSYTVTNRGNLSKKIIIKFS
jgi:hypothetical protein